MWKWIIFISLTFSMHLNAEVKVLAFAGSTREGSINKKLVIEAATVARNNQGNVTVIDLKDFPLPFYNQDLETEKGMPENGKKLRHLMEESDLILIASPEYNGSLSGLLKNTLDWLSRNDTGAPSRDAFQGKKFILLSASPGPGGGARGLSHLKTILENLGATVLSEQFTLADGYHAFDEEGRLKSPEMQQKLNDVIKNSMIGKTNV